MTGVTVVDHPLVARHLSVLRDRETPAGVFREGRAAERPRPVAAAAGAGGAVPALSARPGLRDS